jgi:hypothetical protein
MSVIVKLPSGSWRAQVRRKGKYVSDTFRRQRDAEEALEAERDFDRGLVPRVVPRNAVRTMITTSPGLSVGREPPRHRSGRLHR